MDQRIEDNSESVSEEAHCWFHDRAVHYFSSIHSYFITHLQITIAYVYRTSTTGVEAIGLKHLVHKSLQALQNSTWCRSSSGLPLFPMRVPCSVHKSETLLSLLRSILPSKH